MNPWTSDGCRHPFETRLSRAFLRDLETTATAGSVADLLYDTHLPDATVIIESSRLAAFRP
jgi:hypothetical protein